MRQIEGRTEQKPKQKETSNWWFENSQPIRISKDVQIRRYIVRKTCSGEKVKDVAGQPFGNVEEIRCVIHASPQRSQQKPEQWWDYPGKICGETSCLMVWNNVIYTGDSQDFWECYTSRNTTCLAWKGSSIGWNEGRLSNFQNSISRKQVDKILSYKCDTFQEKGRMTPRVEHMAQRAKPQVTEDYSQALKPSKIFNTGFQNCLGPVSPFFLPLTLFWNICNCYLMPVPPLYSGGI